MVKEELKHLADIKTWEAVERPDGVNIVGSKWVFKVKKDASKSVIEYKAWLVQ